VTSESGLTTEGHLKHFPFRRVFDLLVIIGMACGLLGLAWQVGREAQPPLARSSAELAHPDTPELQLLLPLERIGMLLSRKSIPGAPTLAIDDLERKCREVLSESDHWVISLAISPEEQHLLETIAGESPISRGVELSAAQLPIYPMTHPTGRVGVREAAALAGNAAASGRRLLCWGFILAEGTESQTVWFARPRHKLSSSDSQAPLGSQIRSTP